MACIYRPPHGSFTEFLDYLDELLTYVSRVKKLVFLSGDFNLDWISPSNNLSYCCDIIASYNCVNTVKCPTRITGSTQTLLDPFITSDANTMSYVINYPFSDHLATLSISRAGNSLISEPTLRIRCYNQSNLSNFCDLLSEANWASVFESNNPNDQFTAFMNLYMALYDRAFPLSDKKFKFNHKRPWITNALRARIRRRNRLFSKFLRTRNQDDLKQFRTYRNKLTKDIRFAKRSYFYNYFSNLDNRSMWSHFNKLKANSMGVTDKPVVRKLVDRDTEIYDSDGIACAFANYLKEISSGSSIHPVLGSYQTYLNVISSNDRSFVLNPMIRSDLIKLLNELKDSHSAGLDGIKPKILKKTYCPLLDILLRLYNNCMTAGCFPDILKFTKIIMIYKNGNRSCMTNYRPIAILSCFSKILDKYLNQQLQSFITKFKLVHHNQFGFVAGKSIDMALLKCIDFIRKGMVEENYVLSLFLDVSKAFDSVDHGILLNKLQHYGVRGLQLKLFESYLVNRRNRVSIGNAYSPVFLSTKGVPQGSALGPTLFTLFINDLLFFFSSLEITLFADDFLLCMSGANVMSLVMDADILLKTIVEWYNANALNINSSKSGVMISTRSRKSIYPLPSLTANSDPIPYVFNYKYLGVWISSDLRWNTHFDHICSKLSCNIGMLNSINFGLPFRVKLKLYYAFFYSILNFGIVVTGYTTQRNITRLLRLQKRIMKTFLNLNFNSENFDLVCQQYNIISSDKLFFYRLAICSYLRVVHNIMSPAVPITEITDRFDLRSNNRFLVPFYRSNFANGLLCRLYPFIYNLFPDYLRTARSFNIFKAKLRNFVICNAIPDLTH